jgi:hypothetical protein
MNTILHQTGQQLVISDIDHKIEEYYNSRTDSNQYSWMPRLPSHIQELWNELSLHNGAPPFPYIMTIIHIYGVQQRDEVYTLSANVTHHSPIYQNGDTQWIRIYIHRYPIRNEYGIECQGHSQVNGEEVKIQKMEPISSFQNRDGFMEYLHRLCVDMGKETLDVEGQLESAYNHDAFVNPNR